MDTRWLNAGPLVAALALFGCADAGSDPRAPATGLTPVVAKTPADDFLASLAGLCGASFAGQLVAYDAGGEPADNFEDRVMVMHVSECTDEGVRMPFQYADERARALVVSRTTTGLHLHHEHLREDGVPLELSDYGGTSVNGTALRQEFEVDPYSIAVLQQAGVPRPQSNTWVLELEPGEVLRYALVRDNGPQVVIEFDLANPLELPESPLAMRARLHGEQPVYTALLER